MPKSTRTRRSAKPPAPRDRGDLVDNNALAPIDAPELTILAALHHVLDLATLTLGATHPELASERSLLRPLDPRAVLADQVIKHAVHLAKAMTRYRLAALAALRQRDNENHDTRF
jgi:hypothetical protein